jgi:hypothetical protein
LAIFRSPIDTVSWETKPLRLPDPYWISKAVPFFLYELEADESYLVWRKQAIELHSDEGTHRLELPVSRTTLKV